MTVEIIGRACLAPGASSPKELFDLLRGGHCAVTSVPHDRWDHARFWHPSMGVAGKTYTFAAGIVDGLYEFDAAAFGMSQREAAFMDPQQRMMVQLAWRAMEDANVPLASLQRESVGVFVGASSLDHANIMAEDPAAAGPYFMTGNTLSIVSNRISHVMGLSGPSMTVDTACSSSLVALDQAMAALQSGEIETAIVGGVNILAHPLPFVGFAQARMLSPEGLCRAYDNNGEGYVRAEGGVVFVLRRSDRARRERDRSYGRIIATGVNSAGRTNGISLPSREAQANLLRSIYEGNGIDLNQVAFVEGHGTGTKVGDPAEVWSIGTVIGAKRQAPLLIGSIKSNIGHTEPASGLFGVLKAILALEHDYLPASLHFESPNDTIDFEGLNVRVAATPIKLLRGKRARLVGINSFGFGGANAHAVVSDPEVYADTLAETGGNSGLFLASAHTATSLETLLQAYRERLSKAAPAEARALIAASGANRSPMRHRFAVRADHPDDVVRAIANQLDKAGSGIGEAGEAAVKDAQIAFVFSGNGSQWAGMGVDAFRDNIHFRQSFTSVSALFRFHSDIVLTDLLTDPELETRLRDTKVAQPLLFAVQAALSDSLVALGIRPLAVFGHSIGEIAAAYAAGAIGLVDAVSIVAKRSQHQDMLAGHGTMAAVMLGAEEAADFARTRGFDGLAVAAINAHNSVTMSGQTEEISAFRDAARKAKIACQILDINYPFHHPIIDRAKQAFLEDIPGISPRKSDLAFLSTVTGERLEGSELNSDYWWKNVREPVRFQAATEAAIAMGCTLFVEISPRPILSSYVKETLKHASARGTAIPTLLRETAPAGQDPVQRSMARAVAHGARVDADRVFGRRRAFVTLPSLPFEPVNLRPTMTSDAIDMFGRGERHAYTLAGWRTDTNSGSWKNHIDAQLFPDLAEHVVDGKSILPGSGFIDIALSAARQHFVSDDVELVNLEIVRPLELSATSIAELSTILSPETGDLEIRSRERLSEDGWTVHAVARVRKSVPGAIRANAPAMQAQSAPEPALTSARAYETARQFGLDYGPRFQLLDGAVPEGDRRLSVTLKVPAANGHPHVAYSLHPISVDATFHGLVALFGRLTGERGGAPYIPVRFGMVRLHVPGATIRSATVEIEKFSANSIRASFRFLDASGALIADFEDCRFRRTYLRQHKSLDRLSFHYDSVPTDVAFGPEASALRLPQRLFPETVPGAIDTTTLLMNAAIYRACHDIAMAVADGERRVQSGGLPGDHDFKCFLVQCLRVLEDTGLAEHSDGQWTIESDPGLPAVGEVLREIAAERPDRAVETVLVNNVHAEALVRIADARESGINDPAVQATAFSSEATLDHQASHSGLSRGRMAILLTALEAFLDAQAGDRSLEIAEIGTVSPAFSRRIAALTSRHKARLTVIEPRANACRNLEIAFETDPAVRVLGKDDLDALPAADIVISATDGLFDLLRDMPGIRRLVPGAAAMIATVNAPGLFADFAYGLSAGWYSRSPAPDFPIGAVATDEEWRQCLADLGMGDIDVVVQEQAEGGIISLAARGRPAPGDASPAPASQLTLVLTDQGADPAPLAPGEHLLLLALSGNTGSDRAAILQALGTIGDLPWQAVYLSPAAQDGENPSEVLQRRVLALSAFAEALRASDAGPTRLLLAAPGGAPGTAKPDPVNTGLWTFARVLTNEYDTLIIDSIDCPLATSESIAQCLALASDPRLVAGENREWRVDEGRSVLSGLCAVPGPVGSGRDRTTDFAAATIRQKTSSQVGSIVWEETDIPSAGPGEVVVAVAATGLNFRDVMWAMGLLPEEALEDGFAGATIGMELSGHVVATGAGVTDLVVGDAVMAIAPAAFSTHAVVARSGVARLPSSIDPVAAATLPVAFLTAYYAMVELGRIQPGETILIHGAAGGVGLAALQVAKLKGARVIATAGTVEKRRYLTMMGAEHVFDSRTLNFAADILAVTGGEGVDLVLNSLFADAMELSLSIVKPFGRFLELGKRDYYADSKIGLRPFRRNISYFGIDADQLLVRAPDLTRRLFAEMGALFEQGALSALPYRAFEHDEIGNAFRLMQNAGHIGKIVVTPPKTGRDSVERRAAPAASLSGDGVHLVVGGIGGFGLATANWLVERGARHIALASRRGIADAETQTAMVRWADSGVVASLHACDVTDEAATASMLSTLRQAGPLRTVVHAAMVLDDALVSNLTAERNQPVIDTKVAGASVLDRLTRSDDLDCFLLFSSATTLVGNPGQGNYVAANGYLEGLARARRAEGLPALAVGFGAIADAGYLARNAEVGDLLAKRIGKAALRSRDALQMVEDYMDSDPGTVDAAVVMIAEIDWASARSLPISQQSLFEVILRTADQQAAGADGTSIDLAAMIAGKTAQEGEDALVDLVAGEIAAILRVAKDTVTRSKVLKEIGLDSLMAVELGMNFKQNTGFDLPLSGVADTTTVGDIALRLYEKISKKDQGAGQADTVEDQIVTDLALRHSGAPIEKVRMQ